jgi:2-methylisocitrate lyase-like PEP mutase family enzyme
MEDNLTVSLKNLHIPGRPIVFANIWDVASLDALLSLNNETTKPVTAVATASWAIAASLGIKDEELTLEQNLAAIERLVPRVKAAGLPLTVDLQDGYGERIAESVAAAVRLGVHGANIEDSIPSAGFGRGIIGSLYQPAAQVSRLKTALSAARDAGSPDFVLNARCDVFRLEPPFPDGDEEAMKEAVSRGRTYLNAGATTVFYWGGRRGLSTNEVRVLVQSLDGRVAVKLSDGQTGLSTRELAEVGVARISVGPSLYLIARNAMREAAQRILDGGRLGT